MKLTLRDSYSNETNQVSRSHGNGLARTAGTAIVVLLVLIGSSSAIGSEASSHLELGANFNENLQAARVSTLAAANTKWIRGFLPAYEFIEGDRDLQNDERLKVFSTAADAGYKTVLTYKWDFRRARTNVPPPDSTAEQACFDWALAAIEATRPDLLCLVNETFIDTPDEDLEPGLDGAIPFVRFMQRLSQFVAQADLKTPDGEPLPVSAGGFTRLFDPEMQQHPATQALLSWLATADEISHVNFHIHHTTYEEIDSSLQFIRQAIPDKPLVVTEFSRVWAYGTHRESPIGESDQGRAFAQRYELDPTMTVREYLNACFSTPVPESQFHDFLANQPWFDLQYLEIACDKMEKQGVVLATYAFVQEASGGRGPLRQWSDLWTLNPVFVDLMTVSSKTSRPGINPGFFNTFVSRQKGR